MQFFIAIMCNTYRVYEHLGIQFNKVVNKIWSYIKKSGWWINYYQPRKGKTCEKWKKYYLALKKNKLYLNIFQIKQKLFASKIYMLADFSEEVKILKIQNSDNIFL